MRDRIPDAEFTAFTSRPDDSRARHGISAFPLRHGAGRPRAVPARSDAAGPAPAPSGTSDGLRSAIRKVPALYGLLRGALAGVRALRGAIEEAAFWTTRYRRMREIDLLIVAGSNQLSDYAGGPWGLPYTIYAWSAAARLGGTRVAFLSVGAGPIRSRLSRYFIRKALGWSEFRSYRDMGSRDTVAALGVPGPHRVAPDLAHGLRLEPPSRTGASPSGARTIVVNPLPYFDPRFWAESDQAVYERYVDLLAGFAAELLDRGYRVRFAPTQLRADPPVIADIVRALRRRGREGGPTDRLDPPVAAFEDLLLVLAGADFVVATRFHGVVLAQMLGKPTIGIAYRRSTSDLLADVGQGAYAVEIGDLTLAGLLERLDTLASDRGAEGRIVRRLEAYREALAAQYDLVLGAEGKIPRGARAALRR